MGDYFVSEGQVFFFFFSPSIYLNAICSLMVFKVLSPLTFGSVQFVSRALTPACRMDVRGVCIHPEVVTVRVTVKMETQSVTADLDWTTLDALRGKSVLSSSKQSFSFFFNLQ